MEAQENAFAMVKSKSVTQEKLQLVPAFPAAVEFTRPGCLK